MIDWDFGPGALGLIILIAIIVPVIYSFYVDDYDKS